MAKARKTYWRAAFSSTLHTDALISLLAVSKAKTAREYVLAVQIAPAVFFTSFLLLEANTIILKIALSIMVAAVNSFSFILLKVFSHIVRVFPFYSWRLEIAHFKNFVSFSENQSLFVMKLITSQILCNYQTTNFSIDQKLYHAWFQIRVAQIQSLDSILRFSVNFNCPLLTIVQNTVFNVFALVGWNFFDFLFVSFKFH